MADPIPPALPCTCDREGVCPIHPAACWFCGHPCEGTTDRLVGDRVVKVCPDCAAPDPAAAYGPPDPEDGTHPIPCDYCRTGYGSWRDCRCR